jgi:hypothetical protein
VPRAISSFSTTRSLILSKQRGLRDLFHLAILVAGAASRGDQACLEQMPALIDRVSAGFTEHLLFEDAALLAAFAHGDPADFARARHLAQDHGRQAGELGRLLYRVRAGADTGSVAASFQSLLHTILLDMDVEERWFRQVGQNPGRMEMSRS